MKKNKILFPILGLVASTAAIAPIVSLTSCSKNDKKMESHFTFISGTKQIQVSKQDELVGQQVFTFKTEDTLTEQSAKDISVTAELTKTNSYITILRCWKESIDLTSKIMTVRVAYSINPAALTAKEDSVVEYQLKVEGSTWYQTETDFAITVKKA